MIERSWPLKMEGKLGLFPGVSFSSLGGRLSVYNQGFSMQNPHLFLRALTLAVLGDSVYFSWVRAKQVNIQIKMRNLQSFKATDLTVKTPQAGNTSYGVLFPEQTPVQGGRS